MPESLLLATDADLHDTVMRLLAAADARQLTLAVDCPHAEALHRDGLLDPDGLYWAPTEAGRAWLDGRLCVVCGKPSSTAECNACAVGAETAWKRVSDR